MDFTTFYQKEIEAVLIEKNPILMLDKLLVNKSVKSMEIYKLVVFFEERWEKCRKFNVQFGIIIDENIISNSKNQIIYNYSFEKDISKILKDGSITSLFYIISPLGEIKEILFNKDKITSQELCIKSNLSNEIIFFLGIAGVETWIDGVRFSSQFNINGYKDIIKSKDLNIGEYQVLLKNFFNEYVQFDERKRYFLNKSTSAEEWHDKIDKHPKLLDVKPEERFQIDLEQYLRERCADPVLNEVKNRFGERYDIWVSTSDDSDVYIFELKWLGISITTTGNINAAYNTPDRAIEGAKQLINYIDNSDHTLEGLTQSRIHQGVLVLFDAREEMEDIQYPEIVGNYPNLDVSQHFKIERNKINASEAYKVEKRELKNRKKGSKKQL